MGSEVTGFPCRTVLFREDEDVRGSFLESAGKSKSGLEILHYLPSPVLLGFLHFLPS